MNTSYLFPLDILYLLIYASILFFISHYEYVCDLNCALSFEQPQVRDLPPGILDFYEQLVGLPRKRFSAIVTGFSESVGPLLVPAANTGLLPTNSHQVKRLLQARDRERKDQSLVTTDPIRIKACERGHLVFTGAFAYKRACTVCHSLEETGRVIFFNSVKKRLRQLLNSPDAELYRHLTNPPYAVPGFVANSCDGQVHQRVMEGSSRPI